MAKKENNWIAWAALAIALGALISVLGNAYLTGNFIRVQKTQVGPMIYTKAEIDGKFLSYDNSTILNHALEEVSGDIKGDIKLLFSTLGSKTLTQLERTINSSSPGTTDDRARFVNIATGDEFIVLSS